MCSRMLAVFLVALATKATSQDLQSNFGKTEDSTAVDPFLNRDLLTTDFENGMAPWFDFSGGDAFWILEQHNSSTEPTQAPKPLSGSKYPRVVRREPNYSGTAVLRSPLFMAFPGDEIKFDFWIRSRRLEMNSLEVYMLNGTREQQILSLTEYSSPGNFEWRTVSVVIPLTSPTEIRIHVSGFCGYSEEDSIAIDNMVLSSTLATTTTTTHPTTGPCPSNLGNLAYAPCFGINRDCYCFYQDAKPWNIAKSLCQNYGMKLLSIETAQEDSTIRFLLQTQPNIASYYYYTSGMYDPGTGIWMWDSVGNPFNYTNWHSTEPNGSGNCMYLNDNYIYEWADSQCDLLYYFICEL